MPIVRNGPQQGVEERPTTPARDGSGSAGARGRAVAGRASDQGQEVAGEARAQGQQVAGVASDQAREVAGLVRDQATQLTQELADQGRTLYDETRQQVAEQAEAQTQALARTLHRWGSETQALVEGRPADAGSVGMYAGQCADQLYRAASELEMRGASGLVEELQDFARRRPGAFLFGAALVGFGGGRLLRSAKMDNDAGPSGAPVGAAAIDYTPTPAGASRRRNVGPAEPVASGRGRRRNPPSAGGE